MLQLVADVNVEGHLQTLLAACQGKTWRDLWLALDVKVISFADLGLARNAPDVLVWRSVQHVQAILVTANRNREDEDSLEATIRRENTPDSLPVITISKPELLRADEEYREQAVERFLVYLIEIERYRGAGRIYIPAERRKHA
jgi:hypothetical protein